MKEIKINLGQVPLKTYIAIMVDPTDMVAMFKLVDLAVEGGIEDRKVKDLPAIFAQLTKAIQEASDDLALAISSMQKYLSDGLK